jgi:hypothetical protein
MLGTHWKQGQGKKTKKKRPQENRAHQEWMLSLWVGCMKLLFPKLLVTIFDLG